MILTDKKFRIAARDDFYCKFCGARPGNDNLEIDHLIPTSLGGSDHDFKFCEDNLVVEGSVVTKDVFKAWLGYWIGMDRLHEDDWYWHIADKKWPLPHSMSDFAECMEYARLIVRKKS